MRWTLPLLLIGLVGCATQPFAGTWEGEVGGYREAFRLVMDVEPAGTWTAESVSSDGTTDQFAGTWVMQSGGTARFLQGNESEPAEGVLMNDNHLVLRSEGTETHFQRKR